MNSHWAKVIDGVASSISTREKVEIGGHVYGVLDLKNIPKIDRESAGVYVVNNTPTPDTNFLQKLSAAYLVFEDGVVNRKRDVLNKSDAEVERDLETIKSSANDYINNMRNTIISLGVEYNGTRYDSDERSISNINRTLTLVERGLVLPNGFAWRDSNNINQPMDVLGLDALAQILFVYGNSVYQDSWAAKDDIAALTATADVVQLVEGIKSTFVNKYIIAE